MRPVLFDPQERALRPTVGFAPREFVPESDDPTGAVSGTTVYAERVTPEWDDRQTPYGRRPK